MKEYNVGDIVLIKDLNYLTSHDVVDGCHLTSAMIQCAKAGCVIKKINKYDECNQLRYRLQALDEENYNVKCYSWVSDWFRPFAMVQIQAEALHNLLSD